MSINTIKELYDILNKQIINNNINLFNCLKIIEKYNGSDWKQYVKFTNNSYNKIKLSDFSNELFEIVIICWNNNQSSKIHDHPNNGCVLKVLQGELKEEIYNKQIIDNNVMYNYEKTNICLLGYMEKNNKIHKIINNDVKSVSIHVYSPPDYKPKVYNNIIS